MSYQLTMSAGAALEKLKEGNRKYVESDVNCADISRASRLNSSKHGQTPYAIVVTCSDSRVIPENIFSAGIGDLFIIRVAGNVIDNHQMGSVEYAMHHLGCSLCVVLGHTGCGAVEAAISGDPGGFIAFITDEIKQAIGEEKDAFRAECLNAQRSADLIAESLGIANISQDEFRVMAALYHLDTGLVEFLQSKI